MADNVYTESGATLEHLTFSNNTYGILAANWRPAKAGIFTDLKKWGFTDASGAIHKCMGDGSTSSNTPTSRVLFANSNGDAVSDSAFIYLPNSGYDGVLTIGRALQHSGDANTQLVFSTGQIILETNGGYGFSLNSDGTLNAGNNLMIGAMSTTPQNVLHLHAPSAATALYLQLTDTTSGYTDSSSGVLFGKDASGNAIIQSNYYKSIKFQSNGDGNPVFLSMIDDGIPHLNTAYQLRSTLSTGTAPFQIASTTVVSNLNADMVDGFNIPSGWTDYSSTTTVSGLSIFYTKELKYMKIGKIVFVSYDFSGTSNSTNFSFTLPSTPSADLSKYLPSRIADNGVDMTNFGVLGFTNGSTTVNVFMDCTTTSGMWTASGVKMAQGTFWYVEA